MEDPGPRETITEDDDLYRRLTPPSVKQGVVTAVAYLKNWKPDPEPSVGISRLTSEEEMMQEAPDMGLGLGLLSAAVPLSYGVEVRHVPTSTLYAHALIINNGEKIAPRQLCHHLAAATTLLIPPKPAGPQ